MNHSCFTQTKTMAVALAIALLAPVVTVRAQTSVPASYFGMSMQSGVIGGQPWPTASFGGIRLWDTNTSWAEINTSNGAYNWSYLDSWIAAAQAHNDDLLYTFGNTPQWASSNPNDGSCSYGAGECDAPNDLNADGTGTDQNWKNFVAAVVTHASGAITYWEIWNEPTNNGSWKGTTAQLARMAADAYGIVKSINPNAQVLCPSVSGTGSGYGANIAQWLIEYFADGGGAATDIIAFHGYYSTTAEDIMPVISNIQSALAASGQSGKPIWDTESSWGESSGLGDPIAQAAYVARSYLLHWSSGASRFYWYAWNNPVWGMLWNPNTGTIQPAGTAYIQVYKWLVGSTLTSPCSADANGVWTCELTNSNGQETEAVWNPSGSRGYSAGPQYRSFLDLTGAANVIPANGSITIGPSPILLSDTPVAVLTVSPQSGVAPLTVNVNGSGSVDSTNGGGIVSDSINFGDGTTVNALTATHTYATAGNYNVQLSITDASGQSAWASANVSVAGILISSPSSATAASNFVNFVASAMPLPGNTIISMQILVDSITYYNNGTNSLNANIWIPNGAHIVTVSAQDNTGRVYSSTINLTVGTAQKLTPVAVLTVSPQSGSAPLPVTANGSGSYETGGSISSWSINFGDGTTVNSGAANHTYANAGTYTVKLTVTDPSGATASATQNVTVSAAQQPLTPVAVLTISPQSGTAPLPVTANGAGSYETSGSISSWSINFGDGTTVNSGTANHTYANAGTYTVKLTVTDPSGATASATQGVSVTALQSGGGSPGVAVSAPANGATVANFVNFVASAVPSTGNAIIIMRVFVDSINYYNIGTGSLNTNIWIPSGQHVVTITAQDSGGNLYTATLNLTVQ